MTGMEAAAIIGAVASAASAAGSLAASAKMGSPRPPKPLPSPPEQMSPPDAPTETDAGEGIAQHRRKRTRAFSISSTQLVQPKLGQSAGPRSLGG